MKLKDVQIGGRYVAKVSGKVQVVRIAAKREVFSGSQMRWVFDAVNERTGRRITIRSPQRLRRRVED